MLHIEVVNPVGEHLRILDSEIAPPPLLRDNARQPRLFDLRLDALHICLRRADADRMLLREIRCREMCPARLIHLKHDLDLTRVQHITPSSLWQNQFTSIESYFS